MKKKIQAQVRETKTPKGKQPPPPKAGKARPFRKNTWDSKGRWESDGAGTEWR